MIIYNLLYPRSCHLNCRVSLCIFLWKMYSLLLCLIGNRSFVHVSTFLFLSKKADYISSNSYKKQVTFGCIQNIIFLDLAYNIWTLLLHPSNKMKALSRPFHVAFLASALLSHSPSHGQVRFKLIFENQIFICFEKKELISSIERYYHHSLPSSTLSARCWNHTLYLNYCYHQLNHYYPPTNTAYKIQTFEQHFVPYMFNRNPY